MRRRVSSVALSLLCGLLVAAAGLAVLWATTLPATARAQSTPLPSPSPTIVSQITSKETMYSNTYRLSDGSYQAQIYSVPIRFKGADGSWQSFNTNLLSAGVAGAYRAANLPVALSIGSATGGAGPATLSADGYTVTWTVQGLAAGLPVAPGPASASYLGVGTDTSLSYTALNWGVEQSLVLASSAAPNTFTCTLSHPGLTLAQDVQGQWNLYAPGNPNPIYALSGINVYDASSDGSGDAVCSAATMAVSPGNGQSTLTYTIPRSWLSDPARVFPVTINPTLTLYTNAGNTSYCDTFVSLNSPDNAHGTSAELPCGDNGTWGYSRDLYQFNLSSLSGAYIHSATFEAYKYLQGSSSPTIWVCPMAEAFACGSTWDSLGFVRNTFSGHGVGASIWSGTVAAGSWLSCDATATVQNWASGASSNYGFCVHQDEDASYGTAYQSSFYSADNGSDCPELVVNYDPAPLAGDRMDQGVYTWGNTATIHITANTFYPNDVLWVESGLNLASQSGNSANWRGVVGWFKTSALVPANWTADGTMADGSVIAHNTISGYGNDKISVNFSGCNTGSISGTQTSPGYKRVWFAITIGATFGTLTDATADSRFAMGPSGATTWGSGSCLNGSLPTTPASVGWTAQPSSTFAVMSTTVKTLTYISQGSDYYNSANGPDNSPSPGARCGHPDVAHGPRRRRLPHLPKRRLGHLS